MLVGPKGDLVGDIRVKVSAGLCCNELTTDWSHPGLPFVPGTSELFFTELKSGFFGNEVAVMVKVGK